MFFNFFTLIIIYLIVKNILYSIRKRVEKLEFIGSDCLLTYFTNMKKQEIYFNINDIERYFFSKVSTSKKNKKNIQSISMVLFLKNGIQLTIEKKENVITLFAMLLKFREKEILSINMNTFSLYLIRDQLFEEIKNFDDSIFDVEDIDDIDKKEMSSDENNNNTDNNI